FDDQRVGLAWLETGARHLEARATELTQESFGHATARSVVYADEEHLDVSGHGEPPGETASISPVSSHAAASVLVIVPHLRMFLCSGSTRAAGSSVMTRSR